MSNVINHSVLRAEACHYVNTFIGALCNIHDEIKEAKNQGIPLYLCSRHLQWPSFQILPPKIKWADLYFQGD